MMMKMRVERMKMIGRINNNWSRSRCKTVRAMMTMKWTEMMTRSQRSGKWRNLLIRPTLQMRIWTSMRMKKATIRRGTSDLLYGSFN